MATTPPLDEPIDGRTARAVRTKDAIVDACLALIDEGDLRPTAPRIAERAGVSVRSIFQHFDDLEALFAAVGARVQVRLIPLIAPISVDLPLDERVEVFTRQRAAVLEAVSPVLRAGILHALNSRVINRQFEGGHAFFRDQVREVFAPELAVALEPVALERALLVASGWSTWDVLRRTEHLAVDDARRSQAWMLRAALAAAGVRPPIDASTDRAPTS